MLRPQPPRRPLFTKFRPIFKMIFRHRFRQERPAFKRDRHLDDTATIHNPTDRFLKQTILPSTPGMSRLHIPRTEVTTRAFRRPQKTPNIRQASSTLRLFPTTTGPPMVEMTPKLNIINRERQAVERNFLSAEPKINIPPVHMLIKKFVPRFFKNSVNMFTSPFDQYQQKQPLSTLNREQPVRPRLPSLEQVRDTRQMFRPNNRMYEDNAHYDVFNNEHEREEYPRYRRPTSRFNVFQLVFNRPKYDQHVHSWHSASPSYRNVDDYRQRPDPTLYAAKQPLFENRERTGEPNFACLKPVHSGYCHFFSRKWYFNQYRGRCEVFWYSGCGGSENRFDTEEECSATCLSKLCQNTPSTLSLTSFVLYFLFYIKSVV